MSAFRKWLMPRYAKRPSRANRAPMLHSGTSRFKVWAILSGSGQCGAKPARLPRSSAISSPRRAVR
ncbi:hypothetical protein D9M69_703820 [compost metagenome]